MKKNRKKSQRVHRNSKPRLGRKRQRILSPGLQLAVKAVGGTTSALAQRLGLTAQAVAQWYDVPVKRVPEVSDLTGVSKARLRPDIFGRT
jgi:Putative antitoxin of bacterial toxin-antitoxin system, YdaS/YdaT